ncbi:MAG: DUF3309 domain-containing protein [Rhizobiaceae bacterium]|nr:DUF3309 domain-containing protein [Rhizobiaceae bacterium]
MAILLLFFIVVLIASFPAWPYSRNWGFAPSGVIGLCLVAVLVTYLARGGV